MLAAMLLLIPGPSVAAAGMSLPLFDLAGFKIYWGTSPGSYPNSVTIDNPGLTSYVVSNLTAGTYEFVATAYNLAGVESVFSNTATRTFQ